jgi:hypothetical protein
LICILDLNRNRSRFRHDGANLYGADLRAPTCAAPTCTAPTCAAPTCTAPTCAAPTCAAPTCGANLYGANLYGANLYRRQPVRRRPVRRRPAQRQPARRQPVRRQPVRRRPAQRRPAAPTCTAPTCFIGWKKVRGGVVLKLEIVGKRVSSYVGRKCRTDEAKVLAAYGPGGQEITDKQVYTSIHRGEFKYEVGKTIKPDAYDPDPNVECTGGIHFLMTRKEAEAYV